MRTLGLAVTVTVFALGAALCYHGTSAPVSKVASEPPRSDPGAIAVRPGNGIAALQEATRASTLTASSEPRPLGAADERQYSSLEEIEEHLHVLVSKAPAGTAYDEIIRETAKLDSFNNTGCGIAGTFISDLVKRGELSPARLRSEMMASTNSAVQHALATAARLSYRDNPRDFVGLASDLESIYRSTDSKPLRHSILSNIGAIDRESDCAITVRLASEELRTYTPDQPGDLVVKAAHTLAVVALSQQPNRTLEVSGALSEFVLREDVPFPTFFLAAEALWAMDPTVLEEKAATNGGRFQRAVESLRRQGTPNLAEDPRLGGVKLPPATKRSTLK